MNKTSIEWTDFTWNPIRARRYKLSDGPKTGTFCTPISPGCAHCYASIINRRFGTGTEYTAPNLAEHEFYIDERILEEPLRRKQPAKIFVMDMGDLFHEAIPIRFVGRVFGMMAKCPQHTFQVLTKRAKYMQEILSRVVKYNDEYIHWPMPHVWLGVSVENQKYADERIPLLLQTPAAVRFLSVEPMLEAINLHLSDFAPMPDHDQRIGERLSWVIVGGESGAGARPFHVEWHRSLRAECHAAGVYYFFKQQGSNPFENGRHIKFYDRKGGYMEEWATEDRVRQFPGQKVESVMP